MQRSPYSVPPIENHFLDVWLRSDREPLLSFKRLIGEGFKLTEEVVLGALEIHLQKVVEGCKAATVARSGANARYRDEGGGVIALRFSLNFRTLDDYLAFKRIHG